MTKLRHFITLASLSLVSCSQVTKLANSIIPKKNSAPAPPTHPDGIQVTYTGLKSKILRAGQGGSTPNSLSTVTAHYTGMTLDGEVFDSSITRGEPSEFPLDQVIAGWTEGLQLMTKGEKRRFWIPAKLAYGENPSGGKPGGELIFDIELIDFRQ